MMRDGISTSRWGWILCRSLARAGSRKMVLGDRMKYLAGCDCLKIRPRALANVRDGIIPASVRVTKRSQSCLSG
jgi:hypothetical protein